MSKYYLAFSKSEPIEVNYKPTEKIINNYIRAYGLAYIGIYKTYQDAQFATLFSDTIFDCIDRVDVELHLEKCLALKLDTNI